MAIVLYREGGSGMAEKIRAKINPDILVWARLTAGYHQEEAAKKIAISLVRLQKWESGIEHPTLRQLRTIGNVYKRPTALFYKSVAPSLPPQLPDFRLVYDSEQEYTPQLLFEIRRAFARRDVAIELATQLGENIPSFDLGATLNDSPKQVADALRSLINIPVGVQISWKDHYEALRTWINAIEAMGVLVFHVNNVEVEHMRGFSVGQHPFPIVAINGKDSPRGRIFTLFHELTHIILHHTGVCNLYEKEDSPHNELEVFCNQVAGELLVPTEALLNHELVASRYSADAWRDEELNRLANQFMVSQEVVLRRLLTLEKTTESFYNLKRKEYSEYYKRQKEEVVHRGFVPFYRMVLRTNGRAYTNIVLSAYNNEFISSKELSNYLGGVKLDHVSRIVQAIGAGEVEA